MRAQSIEFKSFNHFLNFFFAEIHRHFPKAKIRILQNELRHSKIIKKNNREFLGPTSGGIIYQVTYRGKTREIEFYKEGHFEWYLGNPQMPIYALYSVAGNTLLLTDAYSPWLNSLF